MRRHPWLGALTVATAAAFAPASEAFAAESKGAAAGGDAKVTPLLSKALTDVSGKEGLMITVEYPPGGSSDEHRHDAHTFVYVLEGAVEMQVAGGQLMTLSAGQTFYESPQDVHTVSRNASKTQPARFVVFMVKAKGAPPVLPAR